MGIINWTGKNTNKNITWGMSADSMIDLYNQLTSKGVISIEDGDPYEEAVLKKAGRNIDDLRDEYGYVDQDRVQEALDGSEGLTDKELWQLIEGQDGNAYYQTFEFNGHELCNADFDASGRLKGVQE